MLYNITFMLYDITFMLYDITFMLYDITLYNWVLNALLSYVMLKGIIGILLLYA